MLPYYSNNCLTPFFFSLEYAYNTENCLSLVQWFSSCKCSVLIVLCPFSYHSKMNLRGNSAFSEIIQSLEVANAGMVAKDTRPDLCRQCVRRMLFDALECTMFSSGQY